MTDEEIAQIVREEWERPMIRANKADIDAFDYFASQGLMQPEPESELITHLTCALVCASVAAFVGSMVILGALGDTYLALAFCTAAYAMLLIATVLRSTCK